MDLKGKTVAITGGAQGLGLAMAYNVAAKGARLALIDMNAERLRTASDSCEKLGAEVQTYAINVAEEAEVEATFQSIARDFGSLDALINNAGITRDALFIKAKEGKVVQKMSLQQWQSVIDVNLTGCFLCGREAAAIMVEQGTGGCIVNISSISRAGNMGQTNYAAAKAGIVAMTVTWAKELARYGIRVGAIAPGFIATEMVTSMKPEALQKIEAMIPAGRLGQPDEIAMTAAYILENDYFTGRVIEMDGGLRL
ncbi:SDR family oxidoreductase [Pokkaliibacter sp. MBI-7]|uniref:SDR family oxidoreductase n=1 Tax=Pokkaliibacter sp. MBI-7 TaxID=3040600 RepID=UPI00244858C9|nr:SDR family oxidoreductase [Pokkaliibacter sp. MBI-7]MDH2431569.1 SDR family oxidoreductase [Pokkaliibacter sp. MBI-7]